MSTPTEAADALLDVLNEHELDGCGPWREVGPEEWSRIAARRDGATAYLEIVAPGTEPEAMHLVADREPVETPTFDDGAAADRARETALDVELGVAQ